MLNPKSATASAADNVRAEMARRRVSQVQIAELLGLSQAAVSRRLSGITPFDVNELTIVAALLDVPAGDLLAPALTTASP